MENKQDVFHKVAELCSNITGINLPPIYKKDRPKEVKHAICSADKARKLLNYKTQVSLNEGIKRTYEYIKKRGVKPFEYHIDLEIDNELTPDTWKNKEI
jgi:UDP-glucose 4-epimerase